MAYDIIKRLKQNNEVDLLNLLADGVEAKRKANNKKHEVWELSFDGSIVVLINLLNKK